MSTSKPTVLVVGSTGNTGFPVSIALLESGKFNVILLCRPGSEDKPRVAELKQKGAQVRLGDIAQDSIEELEKVLSGIEILLIMVSSIMIGAQKNILVAASRSKDIKRVVPSEFALVHLSGAVAKRSGLLNKQIEIRALVKELNLPVTYINVGWWMDILLPYPSSDQGYLAKRSRFFIGTGNVKTAVMARKDIGWLIALVLADSRTINQQVFGYGAEVSLKDVDRVAEQFLKEDIRSRSIFISDEEFENRLQKAERDYELAPSHASYGMITMHVAYHIMFVSGENTLEVAKRLGYLDANVLYPDFKPLSLEEFAKEFYSKGSDIVYPTLLERIEEFH